MLKKNELCQLIPHAGRMCLLDEVLSWDDDTICCKTMSHQSLENPLRCGDHLSSLHAIEYGAQAMAVHGGLKAREEGRRLESGFLVGLRNLKLDIDYLDTIQYPLMVTATKLYADAGNLIYQFAIEAELTPIADGQVSVMARQDRCS
jgi:predicted hotdog family 3-hydroxylacyl-ACP dehydratase